ncbi:MAG: hypothetical protein M2R45_04313 [Verrucomicrobia subdivision 3 bacterium]|nr:hypothetical protein [Limisphaerales bacterium]MCS1417228.1 hypothetical protein [Limisphaerales bacterium]
MATTRPKSLQFNRLDFTWFLLILSVLLLLGAFIVNKEARKQNKDDIMEGVDAEFGMLDERLEILSGDLKVLREDVQHMRRGLMWGAMGVEKNQRAIEALQARQADNQQPVASEQAETADEWSESLDSVPSIDGNASEVELGDRPVNPYRQAIRQFIEQGKPLPPASPEQTAAFQERIEAFRASLDEEDWEEVRQRTDRRVNMIYEQALKDVPEDSREFVEKTLETMREGMEGGIILQMMTEAELRNMSHPIYSNDLEDIEANE